VFIENVDIWGFCSSYFPFLELLFNNYSKLNRSEKELFNIIKELFVTLYITRTKKLDINEIIKLLKSMDNLFEKNITSNTFNSNDVASGIKNIKKTRKRNKYSSIKTNISFKRRPLQKKFKNPIFLSLK
jgi:hypothetical protein